MSNNKNISLSNSFKELYEVLSKKDQLSEKTLDDALFKIREIESEVDRWKLKEKKLRRKNDNNLQTLIQYRIMLENHIVWESRQEYFEMMNKFLTHKINGETFFHQLQILRNKNRKEREKCETSLEYKTDFNFTSKSIGISSLISSLHSILDRVDTSLPDAESSEFRLSDNAAREIIEDIILPRFAKYYLKINKNRYVKLVNKELMAEANGISFERSNTDQFNELLQYDIILEKQFCYQNRFKYKNVLQSYIDGEIIADSFKSQFLDLYYDRVTSLENLKLNLTESSSIEFVSNSKSESFSLLVENIFSVCESVLPANEEQFHQEIQKLYIDIQNHFITSQLEELLTVMKEMLEAKMNNASNSDSMSGFNDF